MMPGKANFKPSPPEMPSNGNVKVGFSHTLMSSQDSRRCVDCKNMKNPATHDVISDSLCETCYMTGGHPG